jgi:hypothetical protein
VGWVLLLCCYWVVVLIESTRETGQDRGWSTNKITLRGKQRTLSVSMANVDSIDRADKPHVPRAWGNFLSFDPSSYDLTTTAFFPAKRPASTTTTLPGLMLWCGVIVGWEIRSGVV